MVLGVLQFIDQRQEYVLDTDDDNTTTNNKLNNDDKKEIICSAYKRHFITVITIGPDT